MPKRIKAFDASLIIIPIILLVVSVAVIYSLVFGTNNDGLGMKQGIIGLIGIGIFFATSFIDYRIFKGLSWLFYLISLILLIIVNVTGKTMNGAESWIDLKFFQLQPSEVAKVFVLFSLCSYFSERVGKIKWRDILFSFILLMVPLSLILMEPDFGTAMVIFVMYFVLLIISKPTKLQLFLIGLVAALVLAVGILSYVQIGPFKNVLKEYQRKRITVFLDPASDPVGSGYNIKQAKITIGSGGILGRSLGKGTQSRLHYLPEAQTDFIFAGIAESFGFLGSFIILSLFGYILLRIINIADLARDNFGMLLCFGVVSMFFFQVLENVGMNLGLMPVTGIPLPFLSSGGTSLLVSFFALGIVESIYVRHKKISF
jgi:rod shape determining protein RodA